MKRFVLNVLVFSAVFATADGIKCYDCIGTEDVCAKDKLKADKAKYLITCSFSFDRCMRVWGKKGNITTVVNSCSNKATCDATKKACDNITCIDGQCDFSCCATDECNAGSAADGLKCYVCSGTEDDCAKDTLEANKAKYLKTCSLSSDRCIRVWGKNSDSTTAVTNGCSSKEICDAVKKACEATANTDVQCGDSCCATDECNAGSTADGIKCYNCLGTKDACAKDTLEGDKATYVKTCPKQHDRCMLYWTIKDDQHVAMSSCADKSLCDATKKTCNGSSVCGVSCCFTHECNHGNVGSSASSVSFNGFVLTVCSILALALFNPQALPTDLKYTLFYLVSFLL